MTIDADEVRVAGAGHVYCAPAGTATPDDLDALSSPWVDLGYVTTDGVTLKFDRTTENLDAWQGSKIRILTTEEPKSVSFTLMQTNADVLQTAFGGGTVTSLGGGLYKFEPPDHGQNDERVLCIEFVDGDVSYRYNLPRTQLEGGVEFNLQRTGATQYPLTFGVLDNGDDPDWNIISDDPAFGAGS
jgi:hypothetical protein